MQAAGRGVGLAAHNLRRPRGLFWSCAALAIMAAMAMSRRGLCLTLATDRRVAAMGPPTTADAIRAASLWQGPCVPFAPASLEGVSLVVDALFGTGLTRAIEGARLP